MSNLTENELLDDEGVWRLAGFDRFDYSDGRSSEIYLEKVFRDASDLSSNSAELESYIIDWPSQYHLTRKRAQLLSGFTFDRSLRVLEVGCGCGSITRLLGERFDSVVSVEGNINRAKLAKLRTRDLDTVSVICAPFQQLQFSRPFDLIICVGVYEYSRSFVDGPDPYGEVVDFWSNITTSDGRVMVAIENQFGLKYFSGMDEDHLGAPFVGLEGYKENTRVRTFGMGELHEKLAVRFPHIQNFYPFPDYKMPDAVVADKAIGVPFTGELVSQLLPDDYSSRRQPLFDYASTVLELSRNNLLGQLANSFLVAAGKKALDGVAFSQAAILYSSGRPANLSTRTRFLAEESGLLVEKRLASGASQTTLGPLMLREATEYAAGGLSLQTRLMRRARSGQFDVALARTWLSALVADTRSINGRPFVAGEHVDSTWSNFYPDSATFIDREWVWEVELPLNVLFLRSAYTFIARNKFDRGVFARRSGRRLLKQLGQRLGLSISSADFADFVKLEVSFQHFAYGLSEQRYTAYLKWFLFDRNTLNLAIENKVFARRIIAAVRLRLGPSR